MLSDSLKKHTFIGWNHKKVKSPTQVLFFQRLSYILSKGYPLVDALKMTGWDVRLKPLGDEIILRLKKGDPLDQAFQKAGFSPMVINFLYFGNVHHDLPLLFEQCAKLLRMKSEYIQKIANVLRYPLLLFLFIMAAFIVMKKTILPNFLLMFDSDTTGTLWLLHTLNLLLNSFFILCVMIILSAIILKLYLSRIDNIEKKITLYEKIPWLKAYHTFSSSYLFTTHLHSLLQTGMPLKQSLDIMSGHQNYEIMSHYSRLITKQLASGRTLGQSIHHCTLLKSELTDLFHQTNDRDALRDELGMLAFFLMEDLQQKLTKWLQLIQPTFFLIIAVIIICIYASIMLPLYQWMQQI
ncbi:hypothetical protein EQV77_02010 [Halobacillus fulvus]|nr:hypothetical protein EQV77_02010 [Halobacillus fulvus]